MLTDVARQQGIEANRREELYRVQKLELVRGKLLAMRAATMRVAEREAEGRAA
jgi:hypothetical protein